MPGDLLTVVAATTGRADTVLAELLPDLSRSRLAALIKGGWVAVDGQPVRRPASKVHAGSVLTVAVPPPVPTEAQPQDLPLRIVHEDDDLAVIDKAPGMVVHPGPGHPDGTLVNALLHHLDGLSGIGGVVRPGIVHRLDRGTSGLLVVAKHDRAHQHLAAQFAAHTAGRHYLALCLDGPARASGTVRSQLARHPRDRVRWASTDDPAHGKRAVTHWQVLDRGALTLVECRLETGRTHQVRVHLTEQGWPLAGDPLYKRRGLPVPATLRPHVPDNRPMLHAWVLQLEHPSTGEPCKFTAAPPADFTALATAAGLTIPA